MSKVIDEYFVAVGGYCGYADKLFSDLGEATKFFEEQKELKIKETAYNNDLNKEGERLYRDELEVFSIDKNHMYCADPDQSWFVELLPAEECKVLRALRTKEGRDKKEREYQTDCFFYEDIRDMSATIPTCDYYRELGYCPCEDCPLQIDKKEVRELVLNKLKKEGKIK